MSWLTRVRCRAGSAARGPIQYGVVLVAEVSDHGTSPRELALVFGSDGDGAPGEEMSVELIFSEAAASATAGIWRFRSRNRRAILKLIRHGGGGSPMWQSGQDEGHWYYWKREALAYSSDLTHLLTDGLRAPACLGVFERSDGSVGIWLEDLGVARPAADWDIEHYRAAALALGQTQARSVAWAAGSGEPWLARSWLRRYVERRELFLRVLAIPAWDHPMVREHLSADTRQEAAAIWEGREALLAMVESVPLCLSHNDLHPGNLFSDSATTILIDWGFVGLGHLGEDPANLVLDAILDYFVKPEDFATLHEAVIEGYVRGVAEVLPALPSESLQRALWAAGAVKYFWIPLAMVDGVEQGRVTLNRKPIQEGFPTWASIVPEIFAFARRALAP